MAQKKKWGRAMTLRVEGDGRVNGVCVRYVSRGALP